MSQSVPPSFTVPTAQQQTSLAASETLHSANSGIVVERVGQLRAELRSEGRKFARELSDYLNAKYVGTATVFVYEETFGTKDRLHWLLHLASLDAYHELQAAGDADDPAAWVGGRWERMFVDGSLRETVLMPQSFGMYGTASQKPETVVSVDGETVERFTVPTAQHQASLPEEETLHSANCGVLMHRSGELRYEFRAEGRQFSRALAEGWNKSLAGHATIFLYEEVFGLSDRVHWLIHLKSLGTYYNLMGLRARTDPAAREVFTKMWIPEEKGGGGWERLFVQGSLGDMALTPQDWATSPVGLDAAVGGVPVRDR